MPAATESQLRRLKLARMLIKQAEAWLARQGPLDHAPALLNLQDATEFVVSVCAEAVSAAVVQNFELSVANIEKAMEARGIGRILPGHSRILALNKARVALKHHGVMGARAEVESFLGDVLSFATDSVMLFLDADFGALDLSDAIRHPKVSREVRRAEGHYAQGDYEGAVLACGRGLAFLFDRPGDAWMWSRTLQAPEESGDVLQTAIANIVEELSDQRRIIKLLASGIPLPSFWRFVALTPSFRVTPSGEARPVGPRKSGNQTQARFCIDFLTDTALRMQEVGSTFVSRGSPSSFRLVRVTRSSDLFDSCPQSDEVKAEVLGRAEVGQTFYQRASIPQDEVFRHELVPPEFRRGLVSVIQTDTQCELWIASSVLEPVEPKAGGDEGPPEQVNERTHP
jgi:hypothetical protein